MILAEIPGPVISLAVVLFAAVVLAVYAIFHPEER